MKPSGIRRTTWLCVGMIAFLSGLAIGRKWPVFSLAHALPGVFACGRSWRHRRAVWLIGIILLCLAIGTWRGTAYRRRIFVYESLYGQQVVMHVTATTDGTYAESGNLGFDAGSLKLVQPYEKALPGLMKFEVRGVPAVYRGDRMEISGKVFPAGGSKQGSIKFASATLLGRKPSRLENFRLRFVAAMQTALPEPVASFGLGVLVGQRSTLPKSLNDQLSTVGLTHIIAVSGYNLTIIVQFVSNKLGKRSKYQITLLSVAFIALFILVTGFSASIVRAGLVSLLSLAAWYYGRTFKPMVLLLLSAVLTAGWNPVYLWSDIGWWLSFLAFFGVLVLSPLITKFFWSGREPRFMMPLVIESASAQIMAAPLIMYIFQETSLISLVSNVLVVPLVPLSMLLLFIAGLGGVLFSQISAWIAWPARVLNSYMLEIVELLSRVPYARIKWPIDLTVLILIYVLVGASCWYMWFKTRPKYARITDEKGA